ncbi:MAG TPA: hypothetical protein VNH41_10175 [Steroidobacteraceae bacterium]|nr:hypothetical protein [Steroidobacteraceae bacterium]
MPAERSEILKHGQFIADAWDARSIGSFSESGPIAYGDIRPLAAAFNELVRYLEQVEAELLAAQEREKGLREELESAQEACWQIVDDADPHRSGIGCSVSVGAVNMCRPHAEAAEKREEALAGSPSEKPDG